MLRQNFGGLVLAVGVVGGILTDIDLTGGTAQPDADLVDGEIAGVLAFAAGAMIYVVVEELIPEASEGEHSNIGTLAFAGGFVLMMVLDVALG